MATWYASLLGEPPALDPVQFGWEADPVNKCLIPQNMRKGTPYAPLHVLQLVRCGCESELSCGGGKCGCMGRQMPCTVFVPVVVLTLSAITLLIRKMQVMIVWKTMIRQMWREGERDIDRERDRHR